MSWMSAKGSCEADGGYLLKYVGEASGKAGLAIMKKEHVDLVISDFRMPVMDGWAFARAYRQLSVPRAPKRSPIQPPGISNRA